MTCLIKIGNGIGLLLFLVLVACSNETTTSEATAQLTKTEKQTTTKRIVSLNGTLTELLYQLGLESQLVGVDVTSTYPEAASVLPNLGHVRQLNVEAVLALKPDLVLATDAGADTKALKQLEEAGVKVQAIHLPQTLDGILSAAKDLASSLETTIDLTALSNTIQANKTALETITTQVEQKPKVLFIYARGSQQLMVAGKETFADKMVQLAGGQLVPQEFESFKQLNSEALLGYQPEVILMFDSGLNSLAEGEQSAIDGLLQIPGMAATPAGKNKRVIAMDGLYLSGFGPRASAAALELAKALHAKTTINTL